MRPVGMRAFSAVISLIQIPAPSISLHNEKEKETSETTSLPCVTLSPVSNVYQRGASLCLAELCSDMTFDLSFALTPPLPSSSILSHKDSVSPVGGGAREDLCHA